VTSRSAALVETYLRERAPAWTHETTLHERVYLVHFLACVQGDVIESQHVLAYLERVHAWRTKRGAPLAAATRRDRLSSVRRFLRWAQEAGHLLQDFSALIVTRSVTRVPRTLSEGEVLALLEQGARDARERAILETLYGTGLRAAELVRLRLDDVDLAAGLVFVRQGKGRKDRAVPLGPRLVLLLAAYLRGRRRSDGPLFRTATGRPLSRSRLRELVFKAGQRAGLARRASPHRLRHSYATHLVRNGGDVRKVQLLLGHASLQSTQAYLDLDVADLHRMLEKSRISAGLR
jgi:site-specific recombinase XerD